MPKGAKHSRRPSPSCRQFQAEHGQTSTDERLDVENQRLNELSSQVVMMQSLSAEASASKPRPMPVAQTSSYGSHQQPRRRRRCGRPGRQEARLQEISARLGEKNPR